MEGISRARIEEYTAVEPFFQVTATEFVEKEEHSTEMEAMTRNLVFQFEQYVKLSKKSAKRLYPLLPLKMPVALRPHCLPFDP